MRSDLGEEWQLVFCLMKLLMLEALPFKGLKPNILDIANCLQSGYEKCFLFYLKENKEYQVSEHFRTDANYLFFHIVSNTEHAALTWNENVGQFSVIIFL